MNETLFLPLLTGFFIIIVYFIYFLFNRLYSLKHKSEILKERLSHITVFHQTVAQDNLSLVKEKALKEAYLQSKIPKIEGLKQWLQHAGLNIYPTFFVFLSIMMGLFILLIVKFVLHAPLVISILLSAITSFVVPWLFVTVLTIKRKNAFLDEFPIALDIMRRALKAGFSVDKSLEMVSEQQAGRVGKMFLIISERMRLGETLEAILGDMANRIGVDDFRMLAIVLVLHRETGGSLAESMENFSTIIRTRHTMRKKMKALTAEVRVTALILTSLPFFILGAVFFTSPGYLDTLFHTNSGQTLLIIGGGMLFSGIGIILRMAYKEIY